MRVGNIHFAKEFKLAMYASEPKIMCSEIYYSIHTLLNTVGIVYYAKSISIQNSLMKFDVISESFDLTDVHDIVRIYSSRLQGYL